jgi:solute carrier family 25 protein 39/40
LSGITAALMTSPFDVLKTRRQAFIMGQSVRQGTPISSFTVLRQILHTEGVKELFAGLTPRMAKIAPACGIMIACYEVSDFTQ